MSARSTLNMLNMLNMLNRMMMSLVLDPAAQHLLFRETHTANTVRAARGCRTTRALPPSEPLEPHSPGRAQDELLANLSAAASRPSWSYGAVPVTIVVTVPLFPPFSSSTSAR